MNFQYDIMIMVKIMDMLVYHIKLKYHFQFRSNDHNQRDTIKLELKSRHEHVINMELINFLLYLNMHVN